VAGGGSDERQWRGCGGAPAAARVLVRLEVGKINAWPWELRCSLGKRLEALAGGGSERRKVLACGGGNGGGGRRAHARRRGRRLFIAKRAWMGSLSS
jgi:hypothetical protein